MDSGYTPPSTPLNGPEPSAAPPAEAASPAPMDATPQPAPVLERKRGLSKGAKWAIGITLVVGLLIIGSCALIPFLALPEPPVPIGDSIALIHLEGVIAGTGTPYDGIVAPEYVLDQLDQALDDDQVKAILLRIDSPGGTVAASQEIALAVRRASVEKPVVVSVGDMCASGAYMVASQADSIVASPGSSVGSIGVIMEIPNIGGLLDKLGVEFTVLTEGELKDVGNPYRSVTPTETTLLKAQMKVAYEQFIADVAKGRGMDEDKVRELATGWVWLGSEAKDLGLIDKIGNYNDAVDEAADLGGIEGAPNIVTYEPKYTVTDLISDLIGLQSRSSLADAGALRRLALPR
jgi:protease-4